MLFYCYIGIWADDSGDENEDKQPVRGGKKPKNYSAPIGFIAGGFQQAGKKDKKEKELKMETEDSDQEKPSTSFNMRDSSESEDERPTRTG